MTIYPWVTKLNNINSAELSLININNALIALNALTECNDIIHACIINCSF